MALPKKNTDQKTTIAALDGVRAIACLSIIEYHVHYLITRSFDVTPVIGQLGNALLMVGWSGVTLFFVLSGFLLFMPYANHLLFEQPRPSTRTFYLRRALRILPGYYLALLLLIILAHPHYFQWDHLGSLGLFLTLLMDAPSSYQRINGPFWSLAVEWQYYLLLPVIAQGFSLVVRSAPSPLQRYWRVLIGLVGMILWGIGTRYLGNYYTLHPTETLFVPRWLLNVVLLLTYGSSGKYLEDFAIGMLCCTIYMFTRNTTHGHTIRSYLTRYSTWLWGMGILVLCFMAGWSAYVSQLIFLKPFIGAHSFLTEFGFALGFGLCLIAILFGPPGLKLVFEWQPLRWIGSISFSLYLWHLPILLFFRDTVINQLTHSSPTTYLLYWACVSLVIIPFAYVLYRVVERPWMKLAHTRPNN